MKILQIFGLIINLFFVFIIISYSQVAMPNIIENNLSLKRISILLIKSYIFLNLHSLKYISDNNFSFLDGKIIKNEIRAAKITLIFILSIIILYNQNNKKKEKYIIILTNL